MPRRAPPAAARVADCARRRRDDVTGGCRPCCRRRQRRRSRAAADCSAPTVDVVSLNVTVVDRPEPLRHRSRRTGLLRLRRRHAAGADVLQPHEPADCAVAADRHEREHGKPHADCAGSGHRLRAQAARRRTSRRSSTSTAASRSLQDFTNSVAELERAIRDDRGRRFDVAAQRALHLAERAGEDQGEDRRTRCGAGRSSCCRTARTRRAWSATKKCSTSPSVPKPPSTRLACRPRTRRRRRDSARPSSCCGSSRRKPAAARSFRSRVEDLKDVYGQIADELSSQYTIGYASKNAPPRRRLAAHRRPGARARSAIARTKRGYYAPRTIARSSSRCTAEPRLAVALCSMQSSPSRICSRSSPTRFTSRAATPATGRAATDAPGRRRARPHLRHRHADDGGGARAVCGDDAGDLDVRVAAGARLSLHRSHHRRARARHLRARRSSWRCRCCRRCSGPASSRDRRCSNIRCSGHTSRRCSAPTRASASRR